MSLCFPQFQALVGASHQYPRFTPALGLTSDGCGTPPLSRRISENPEGIPSQSPGLARLRAYPGTRATHIPATLKGLRPGQAMPRRNPFRVVGIGGYLTQGRLADSPTLGFGTKPLRGLSVVQGLFPKCLTAFSGHTPAAPSGDTAEMRPRATTIRRSLPLPSLRLLSPIAYRLSPITP